MKILILRSALKDLRNGMTFYDSQGTGLGEYFSDCILSDIESLLLYAGIHNTVHGYRRLLCKRFPYAIYYEISRDEIRIRAILDCRRSPSWIADRLKAKEQLGQTKRKKI